MVANGNFAQITAGHVRYSTISSDFAGQRNGNVEVVQRQRRNVAWNVDIARAKSTLFVYTYFTNFIRNTHNRMYLYKESSIKFSEDNYL